VQHCLWGGSMLHKRYRHERAASLANTGVKGSVCRTYASCLLLMHNVLIRSVPCVLVEV
jgi:hypothetical protein